MNSYIRYVLYNVLYKLLFVVVRVLLTLLTLTFIISTLWLLSTACALQGLLEFDDIFVELGVQRGVVAAHADGDDGDQVEDELKKHCW